MTPKKPPLLSRFTLSLVSDYEEELTAFGLLGDNMVPDPDKPLVAAFDKVIKHLVYLETIWCQTQTNHWLRYLTR